VGLSYRHEESGLELLSFDERIHHHYYTLAGLFPSKAVSSMSKELVSKRLTSCILGKKIFNHEEHEVHEE